MDSTSRMISVLWFFWGGALLVVFVAMTLFLPLFGDDARPAWEWFIPNLFPPLGLVLGVSFVQRGTEKAEGSDEGATAVARKGLISAGWVVAGLSVLYLLLLSLSVLGCLFSPEPVASLRTANLWLGPLLALATATLGTRFAS